MHSPERTHDVYFSTSAKRVYFRNDNRGIIVRDDGLAWTLDERPDEVNFSNIAGVHLQTGGDWRNPLNICAITLRDGYTLIVTSGGSLGAYDEAQAPVFRGFITDLHDRLARTGHTHIAFTAGYRPLNYGIILVSSILLGLMFIATPLIIFVWKRATEALWILASGAFLVWPLSRMILKNTPRSYNPRSLPVELLS